MANQKGQLQLVFVVLPRQVTDIYAAVKKRCAVDYGSKLNFSLKKGYENIINEMMFCLNFLVPSQCFVAKNAHNPKGLMSIATKVVVQVNAKLGGEPWFVQVPLKVRRIWHLHNLFSIFLGMFHTLIHNICVSF